MPDVQPIALEATQDTLPLGLLATAGFLSMSGARVMDNAHSRGSA